MDRAKLITQADNIRGTMKFWRENYGCYKDYPAWKDVPHMLALGDKATVADFGAAGLLSHTLSGCSVCSERFPEVLQLGDEPDYDSSTVWICRGCVGKLDALFG